MTTFPDPLQAVTHPDAAGRYEHLTAQGVHSSPAVKCWVATSPGDVTAVLVDPRCRVRPQHEPVPTVLKGSTAEVIFSLLVRMTDGEHHARVKEAMVQGLVRCSEQHIRAQVARAAHSLGEVSPLEVAYQMPTRSMALLLGIPETALEHLAGLMGQCVVCITPGHATADVREGMRAAPALWQLVEAHLSGTLAPSLPPETRIANAIGLLWQAYVSTASLMLHGLLALQHQPLPTDWSTFLTNLVRAATPVQNTRRFITEDGVLLGQDVKCGEMILLLAAANQTLKGVGVSFGHGTHRCPGQRLAFLITEIALTFWQKSRTATKLRRTGFRPSANARIPLLEEIR